MTNYRGAPLAAHAFVVMKDSKMMLMKDGNAISPMDYEITLSDGTMVMPDGTVKMKDGTLTRLKEDQMLTMDGKMVGGVNSVRDKDVNGPPP